MKFSEHWLRSLVDPPIDSAALADALTMAGLEVEERIPARPRVSRCGRRQDRCRSNVIPMPTVSRVCSVDVGRAAPLSIVCGAPNVAAGMMVPCALVGAELPEGLDHQGFGDARRRVAGDALLGARAGDQRRCLRAAGARCADRAGGTDLRQALDLDDTLLTLKLTPNRADCLSLIGIAREVAAITSTPFVAPARPDVAETASATRAVQIESPQACPRFCGRVIEGIDARAPTPGLDEAAPGAQRHPLHLGGGRRHQLRDAGDGPAAARLRRRACSREPSSCALRVPASN